MKENSKLKEWKELKVGKAPWALLVCCKESEIDNFAYYTAQVNKEIVRFIRGRRCPTSNSLLQEFAAALQFPYYFGHNWDALDECLSDLEWLQGSQYIIIITQANELLKQEGEKFGLLLNILTGASEYWMHPSEMKWTSNSIPFHVIFHCEQSSKQALMNRCHSAGIQLFEIVLEISQNE